MLPWTPGWQQQNEHRKEPNMRFSGSETQDLLFRVHRPWMDLSRGIPGKQRGAAYTGFLIPTLFIPNCPSPLLIRAPPPSCRRSPTIWSINDIPSIRWGWVALPSPVLSTAEKYSQTQVLPQRNSQYTIWWSKHCDIRHILCKGTKRTRDPYRPWRINRQRSGERL